MGVIAISCSMNEWLLHASSQKHLLFYLFDLFNGLNVMIRCVKRHFLTVTFVKLQVYFILIAGIFSYFSTLVSIIRNIDK